MVTSQTKRNQMKIDSFREEFFFLSNFYPVDLEVDGKKYASSEHYYQACKALDPDEHEKIRKAPNAGATKKIAKAIKSFNPNWDNVRLDVMRRVLLVKFAIPELKEVLLMTGDAYLEEGNWWGDSFWGVCRGEGKNHLGKMLMEIRKKFQDE